MLPDEVNLIVDEDNGLWYSTKGWYRATFTENNGIPAPTVVMTLTTDTLGNSRIAYAVTADSPNGGGTTVVEGEQ